MAWDDVPSKMAVYRTIQYGGDVAADRLLAAYVPYPYELILTNVPVARRADFEADLNYRFAACKNLSTSVAWNPKTMNPDTPSGL